MASNGRIGLRSGSPSFLVVGLTLVIVVLLYSYWSVSSRNSMLMRDQLILQDRLRALTGQKIAAEKQKSSAMAQVASIEKKKRQLEGDVMSSSKDKSELNTKLKALERTLDQEKHKAIKLQQEESKSKTELQKLKVNIDQTTAKLKELTKKTNSFVEMYNNLKQSLAKKNQELFKIQNDWHECDVKLTKLREEHSHSQGDAEKKKGRSNSLLQQGIAHLKKTLAGSTLPTRTTVNAESQPEKPSFNANQVNKNVSLAVKPTEEVTDSGKPTSNNATNAIKNATTGIGSTDTTLTNTITDNKDSSSKPTKTKVEDQSEEENSEDAHKEDKLEDTLGENEGKSIKIPMRGKPLHIRFPERTGNEHQ